MTMFLPFILKTFSGESEESKINFFLKHDKKGGKNGEEGEKEVLKEGETEGKKKK